MRLLGSARFVLEDRKSIIMKRGAMGKHFRQVRGSETTLNSSMCLTKLFMLREPILKPLISRIVSWNGLKSKESDLFE